MKFKKFYNELEKIDKDVWYNDYFHTIDFETPKNFDIVKFEKKYNKFISYVNIKWKDDITIIYTLFLSDKARKKVNRISEVW